MNIKQASMLAIGLLGPGCAESDRTERASGSGAGDESGDQARVEVDEDAIMELAYDYENRLMQLSTAVEESETHADAASVFVWGSEAAAPAFHSIDPNDPTQAVDFPEGTMFVKEHFDAAGEKVGLTVMFKAEEGYNEGARDWFWARTRGDALEHVGRVDWCADCHSAAHNSDFVVGFAKSP